MHSPGPPLPFLVPQPAHGHDDPNAPADAGGEGGNAPEHAESQPSSRSSSPGPEVDFFARTPSRSPTPPPGTLVQPSAPDMRTLVSINLPHTTPEDETCEWFEEIKPQFNRTFTAGHEGSAVAPISGNRWVWNGQGKVMYVDYSVQLEYSSWLSRLLNGRPMFYRPQPNPHARWVDRMYSAGFGPLWWIR